MAWSVDQPVLGTAAIEAGYGDTSMAFTTSVATAAGVWIVGFGAQFFSDPFSSCSDDGGSPLTWQRFQARPDPTGDLRLNIALAWSPAVFASGRIITAGWTGGDVGNKFFQFASFLGGDAAAVINAIASNFGTGTAWSLPYTTTADGELVVGVGLSGSGATFAPSGGTNELFDTGSSGSEVEGSYEVKTPAGTDSLNATLSFSDTWGAYGLRLTPAAGAAGPTIQPWRPHRMPLGA